MNYQELKERLTQHEETRPEKHLTAHIVFTLDSFEKEFSLESRTYIVSSYNKAFRPNMSSDSIFGDALDGSDPGVRLEQYMAEEYGGKNGWKVENCCLVDDAD